MRIDSKNIIMKTAGAAALAVALAGCIADTAEDSELPWSSNRSWEGIAPISPTVMERYE